MAEYPKIRIGSDVGDGVELEGGRSGDLESFNIDPVHIFRDTHVDLVDGSPHPEMVQAVQVDLTEVKVLDSR